MSNMTPVSKQHLSRSPGPSNRTHHIRTDSDDYQKPYFQGNVGNVNSNLGYYDNNLYVEKTRTLGGRSPVRGLNSETEKIGHGGLRHSYNNQGNDYQLKTGTYTTASTLSSMTHRNNLSMLEKSFDGMGIKSTGGLYGNYYENEYTQQSESTINLEDLMILEERLVEVIYDVTNGVNMTNQCFEWWNFFFNCSLCGKFKEYFKDEKHKQIISDFENLELLSVIICYHISFTPKTLLAVGHLMRSILEVAHRNYLVLCDYIISRVSAESLTNVWVIRLRNLLNQKLQVKFRKGQHITEIMGGNDSIYDYLRIVLKNSPEDDVNDTLIAYFKNITKINTNILNDFYRQKVLRVANKNASVIASVVLESGEMQEVMPFPYIKKETKKEYSLVLDLDETLIHFKADDEEAKGTLRLRPGLFDFLDNVCKHYELIIFTASTQDVSI
jgi:hypothetical protein